MAPKKKKAAKTKPPRGAAQKPVVETPAEDEPPPATVPEPETDTDGVEQSNEVAAEAAEAAVEAQVEPPPPPEPLNLNELLQPSICNSLVDEISKDEIDDTKHIVFKNGHEFTGTVERGELRGKGTFVWKDKTTYCGEFESNHVQGQGEMVWPNGDTYCGAFARGLRHGVGTFRCAATGTLYEGEWVNGQRHGHGRSNLSNGCVYVGAWSDGKRDGQGSITYADGNQYIGSWKTGQRWGFGEMKWVGRSSKQVYRGQWEADLPHGYGECVWFDPFTPLDELHVGAANMQQQQQQPQTDADVERQLGDEVDQQQQPVASEDNGAGQAERNRRSSLYMLEKQRERSAKLYNWYRGAWVRGLREGEGTFHFADGSLYSGHFQQDQKHGPDGTFVFVDGRVYHGAFEHDVMVGAIPDKADDTPGSLRVELSIEDISPASVGLDSLANKRSVDHVLLRWKASLRSWFALCCRTAKAATPMGYARPSGAGARGGASSSRAAGRAAHTPQAARADAIWAFLLKCRVPDTRISLAYVNRMLAFLQTRHVDATTIACPSLAQATESFADAAEIRVHDPTRLVLFREFVELLVRVAHEKYRFDYTTLADRFTHLATHDITAAYPPNSASSASSNINMKNLPSASAFSEQMPASNGNSGSTRSSMLMTDATLTKGDVKVWTAAQGINRVLELAGNASTHPSAARLGRLMTVPLISDYTTTPRAVARLFAEIGATKFAVCMEDDSDDNNGDEDEEGQQQQSSELFIANMDQALVPPASPQVPVEEARNAKTPTKQPPAGKKGAGGNSGRPSSKGSAGRPSSKGSAGRPSSKGSAGRPTSKGSAKGEAGLVDDKATGEGQAAACDGDEAKEQVAGEDGDDDEADEGPAPVSVEMTTWMILDATKEVLAGGGSSGENGQVQALRSGSDGTKDKTSLREATALLEHELTEIELSKVLELVAARACENSGLKLKEEHDRVWNCLLNKLAPV